MRKACLIALLVLILSPVSLLAEEVVKAYEVKIWSNDGDIWTLHDVHDRGMSGRWHYWIGSPEEGVDEEGELDWGFVDYIDFDDNFAPWDRGPGHPRIYRRAHRATVTYNSGEVRSMWIFVDEIVGKDDYGKRKVYGEDMTRIDFLTTYHVVADRCPNGHVWKDQGFRYCPYDGQRLVSVAQN